MSLKGFFIDEHFFVLPRGLYNYSISPELFRYEIFSHHENVPYFL